MDKLTKHQFVKQLESLIRKTDELSTVTIDYGYLKGDEFTQSERELVNPDDPREMLKISYETGSTVYQSVEADSCYGILLDAMKGIEELRKYYR